MKVILMECTLLYSQKNNIPLPISESAKGELKAVEGIKYLRLTE